MTDAACQFIKDVVEHDVSESVIEVLLLVFQLP